MFSRPQDSEGLQFVGLREVRAVFPSPDGRGGGRDTRGGSKHISSMSCRVASMVIYLTMKSSTKMRESLSSSGSALAPSNRTSGKSVGIIVGKGFELDGLSRTCMRSE